MERLQSDPMFKSAVENAKSMYGSPEKAAEVIGQLDKSRNQMNQMQNDVKEKLSDAQLGMQELAKSAQDPKVMAEAMEMLKDPEIAKEVS